MKHTGLVSDVRQDPDLVVHVLAGPVDPELVRRFQDVTDRAQDCGLLVPPHRYVISLDPPQLELPTEVVHGRPLAEAVRDGLVHECEASDVVLALLRLGREVLRSGGDMLTRFSMDRFAYGFASVGTGVYFIGLDPAVAAWDRDISSASRGLAYGQLVADAADLLTELEELGGWALSAARLAVLSICAEIEEVDPDQPWTGLLRDAMIEGRPSNWRDWVSPPG